MSVSVSPNPAAVDRSGFSLRDFLSSFMLLELFKGMALTGKYLFRRKVTVQFPRAVPGREDALESPLPWSTCLTPL